MQAAPCTYMSPQQQVDAIICTRFRFMRSLQSAPPSWCQPGGSLKSATVTFFQESRSYLHPVQGAPLHRGQAAGVVEWDRATGVNSAVPTGAIKRSGQARRQAAGKRR